MGRVWHSLTLSFFIDSYIVIKPTDISAEYMALQNYWVADADFTRNPIHNYDSWMDYWPLVSSK